jgi:hypothetical protein
MTRLRAIQQDRPIIRDKIEPLARDSISWVMGQLGGGKLEAAPAQAKYLSAKLGIAEVRMITATGTLNATVNVEVGSQLSGQVADVLAGLQ